MFFPRINAFIFYKGYGPFIQAFIDIHHPPRPPSHFSGFSTLFNVTNTEPRELAIQHLLNQYSPSRHINPLQAAGSIFVGLIPSHSFLPSNTSQIIRFSEQYSNGVGDIGILILRCNTLRRNVQWSASDGIIRNHIPHHDSTGQVWTFGLKEG